MVLFLEEIFPHEDYSNQLRVILESWSSKSYAYIDDGTVNEQRIGHTS